MSGNHPSIGLARADAGDAPFLPPSGWVERVALLWADQPLRVKGLVVISLPLAILFGALVSLHLAAREEARAEEYVRLTFAIQGDIQEVHALLAEAATGVRGYLLTGRDNFLQPYTRAKAELPQTLARLNRAVRDEEQTLRLQRVEPLVRQKLAGLDALRGGLASGVGISGPTPDQLQALVDNKSVLDDLRQEIDALAARESDLLRERTSLAEAARSRNLTLTAISGAVGLLGSVLAVLLFSTGIVRRAQLLKANAHRLERGEPLVPMRREADEIGHLAHALEEASALLHARARAVRESEERYRIIVEGVRDYGIFALDPDGRVVSWNAGAQRIKGYTADEMVGHHFSRFYPDEDREWKPELELKLAREEGRVEDEGWRVRKDGTRFWANVVVTTLHDENGALKGFSKITRDITERKRAEERLREAQTEAERASQAKSEFLSRMSHELRTPLNAILGFAQVLDFDLVELEQRRSLEQILKGGRHLLGLIDEVLDIARIEAGRLELAPEPIEVSLLLRELCDLGQPLASARSVTLAWDGSEASGLVLADRRRLTQVLLNLVSNAVKYNRSGGSVRLGVEPAAEAEHLRLAVVDTGIGIEPAKAERLFTAFDRLGAERASVEGTGLGLALSKSLTEAMGGRIGFTSEPGLGSTFWVELPASARAAEGPGGATCPVPAATQAEAGGEEQRTVLYIEDNPSNLALVETVLRRRPSIRLISAMLGRLGLALAAEHRPDLVLIDLDLPDIGGEEVLRRLRESPELRDVPVVMVSADATSASIERLGAAGAQAYVTKPIDVPAFLSTIDGILAR